MKEEKKLEMKLEKKVDDKKLEKKIKINDVEIDDYVYPRPQKDLRNIASLVDKLKAGVKLDPVIVQKIKMPDDRQRVILLNGAHRLEAHLEQKITDISFEYWKDEVLDYEANKDNMLLFSHQTNDKQGLNMRSMDTRETARKLRRLHPDWSAESIGKKLNRAQQTIHGYIQDIIQEQKTTNHRLVMRLCRLGWKQVDIASLLGKSEGFVSQIFKKTDVSKIKDFYKQGKKPEKIGEMFDLDEQTVWSIVLEGKSDKERFDSLEVPIKTYDVWNFSKCNTLMGQNYPGRLPGQTVMNTLYYYSKQDDLVVDLMAGGGTVADACLLMGRRCYCFDVNPVENRKDIIQHNYLDGLPSKAKNTDLILVDPPYFKVKEVEYGSDSISAFNREDFLKTIDKLAEVCEGHMVAFVMGKYYDYENPTDGIFMGEYVDIFEKHGFRQVNEISINQTPPEGGQYAVLQSKKNQRMETIKCDLAVFNPKGKALFGFVNILILYDIIDYLHKKIKSLFRKSIGKEIKE